MINININDRKYPERLRKIKKPPKQLYLEGNYELLEKLGMAIIGSRSCTKYGEKMALKFAKELSLYGLVIISGMAIGVDSFAHLGCLEAKGKTIAVLPSGFNNIFPQENEKLFKDIIKNEGLVITEYEENEKADYNKYLERNRIISGLSIGTLVVEGGYRSGASVTANLANQQGKKVFCVPSSLENKKGITPNKLIKEGAFLVTEVEDIINQYSKLNFKKQDLKNKTKEEFVENEYKDIYNVLEYENQLNINEIAQRVNLSVKEVNSKLLMLELQDKVISLPGSNYIKA